jgi:hypothetical protein
MGSSQVPTKVTETGSIYIKHTIKLHNISYTIKRLKALHTGENKVMMGEH